MAFGSRKPQAVAVKVKSFGEERELLLRPLTALEADQLDRAFPRPVPPRTEVEGKQVLNRDDLDYRDAVNEWAATFLLLRLCRMIAPAEFDGATDTNDQIKLLKAEFTVLELAELIRVAEKVQQGEDPAAHAEAAKERLTPTERPSIPPIAPED